MPRRTLYYNPTLFVQWKKGRLPRRWRREYASVFDSNDLRLALSQPSYHFGEWYVARHFAKKGYRVLIEKYIYSAHPRKIRTMKKRWPGLLSFSRYLHRKYHCQPPDLLVYKGNNLFFAEVKRDEDRVQRNRRKFFAILRKDLDRRIEIWHVLEERGRV